MDCTRYKYILSYQLANLSLVADYGVFISDKYFLVTHPVLLVSGWIQYLRIGDDLSYS
jgi:hypothetical protein